MTDTHKNECRGGARQVVKTITKRTADFIAALVSVATADAGLTVAFAVVALQAALMALPGVLQ